jgi:hypothetical protein
MSNTETGQVRMPLAALAALRLEHLVSGLDEQGEADCGEAAVATCITGYTEWTGSDRISIGWDWEMQAADAVVTLQRTSDPASNVVLCDAAGGELEPDVVAVVLETYIDDLQWESITLQHIVHRYVN